ncbi:LacI family DNA-binding transcriptional regulator [Brachybacterium sp. ACRRE]|uniref:LacI family DNA-binding transcriptional regulator n=1 Tax=Brachybacterium sp. ACRRE TaxID=2918184 RepID=UPI001EF2A303|nr:LacI family DNA-binding transcriptional regulator [Brachybacterium sp. ACRRE]MCG7310877.1 LacI family transcriptional regulator [Brachybacterium sp. ACRRE]
MNSTGRPATLADVAKRAGVSVATASFVLSGRGGERSSGSPETKAKVRGAAEELGYVPNRNARSLRTGRNGGIVLALGMVEDPWGLSLAGAVRDRALPQELSTLLLGDERWFEFLSGSTFDCSCVTSVDVTPEGPEQVRHLARGQCGIVAFSERIEPERFDVISSSAQPAVHAAYRRLRARHDSVAFMTGRTIDPERRPYYPSRAHAFLDAAVEAGDARGGDLVHASGTDRQQSFEYSQRWLEGPDRPTAVICSTGYLALALQVAAMHAGISVPDDLEIISIGDVPADAQMLGPISYYGVQDVFARMADIIVGRALDREGTPGRLHRFDWEFFPGGTTVDGADGA